MKMFLALFFLIQFVFTTVKGQTGKDYAVSSELLEEWVYYLASDEMRGRLTGTVEMNRAADWIAGIYDKCGLKPLNNYSGFLHEYSFSTRSGETISDNNIIGMIEGNDPELRDEIILITAHYDHVGVRRAVDGDSIYNGADDNAAGTCTLLGVAGTISEKDLLPGRTIIFAAVSGEEMGLRGSRHIAANPPFPVKNVFANINFEMTGHSEYLGPNNYYMTGCEFSNLDDIIKEYNNSTDFRLIDTISFGSRLFYMSDNIAFSRISTEDNITYGIPSGTFATTTFADYIHSPFDEAELFDFQNMAGLVDYFTGMVIYLSNTRENIDWTDNRFSRLR